MSSKVIFYHIHDLYIQSILNHINLFFFKKINFKIDFINIIYFKLRYDYI
jgi:hypothetical protein